MFTLVARVAEKNKKFLSLVAISICIGCGVAPPAQAIDTGVTVDIAGSTAPDLQLDGSTSIVSSMPIILNGRISNLTQIQVYVDGIFTATIPLTPSDTTFSYSLWVSEGAHTVKFVGVSAYTSTNVEKEVLVDFRAPTSPTTPIDAGTINNSSSPRTNGIIVGDTPSQQGQQPSGGGGIKVPQWVVSLLVPLDIINPDKVDETPRTVRRLLFFVIGLPLIIFAQTLQSGYSSLVSKRFKSFKLPVPTFLKDAPVFWLRSFGLTLLVATFLWV